MPESRPRQAVEFVRRLYRHVSWRSSLAWRRTYNRIAGALWSVRKKRISAMVRVKNEEEFFTPSILSIAHLVDEIVIVDNLSTDGTPRAIERLARALGDKVRCYSYPHDVAEMGRDYHALQDADPGSPGLLHNYYNWCLARCRMPFIMKWDADMIALDEFEAILEKFQFGPNLKCSFGGHNLAPDRKHVLAYSALIEPRIYPRHGITFSYGARDGCELLKDWVIDEMTLRTAVPLYLHMRYCKSNVPLLSQTSPGFREKAETLAGPAPAGVNACIDKWSAAAR